MLAARKSAFLVDPRNTSASYYSTANTELIYSGRYSPNLFASALAVVAGCMVHYCNWADLALLCFAERV